MELELFVLAGTFFMVVIIAMVIARHSVKRELQGGGYVYNKPQTVDDVYLKKLKGF